LKKIIVFAVIMLVVILTGCSTDGATGNVVNKISDLGYAGSSDQPQKKVKITGSGHEQACN
jgi:outer membrane murein-binding lipoprotein Lpp